MASYLMVMQEIHVLVVDSDSYTATLLERCQYKVTHVELASTGIRLLLSEKKKFDMVIADINSADHQGLNLLKEAVNMNIPIMLMAVEDNIFVAARVIENGAFLYIKKPTTMEMVKCLWQHVMKEKAHTIRERDRLMTNNPNDIGAGNTLVSKDTVKSNKNMREIKSANHEEELDSIKDMMVIDKNKRKASVEWTQELHNKFMKAVEQLGEARCFPKDILKLMNVPGLTKMQVASHLQRCRDNKWPSAKGQRSRLDIQPMRSNTNLAPHKPRNYGSMSRSSRPPSYHVDIQDTVQARHEIPSYGVIENMTIGPTMTNTFHHEQYGSLEPYSRNVALGTNLLNHMHPSHNLFSFPEMDNEISSFFDLSQGFSWMHNPDLSYGENNFDAVHHEQDITVPSMGTMTNWSSQTSNFGCDDSYARSQYKY